MALLLTRPLRFERCLGFLLLVAVSLLTFGFRFLLSIFDSPLNIIAAMRAWTPFASASGPDLTAAAVAAGRTKYRMCLGFVRPTEESSC